MRCHTERKVPQVFKIQIICWNSWFTVPYYLATLLLESAHLLYLRLTSPHPSLPPNDVQLQNAALLVGLDEFVFSEINIFFALCTIAKDIVC